jgi:acyl-CoA thioesterase
VSRRGRSGIYDIRITTQDGAHVAEFRGHSRSVKGTHLPE